MTEGELNISRAVIRPVKLLSTMFSFLVQAKDTGYQKFNKQVKIVSKNIAKAIDQ
jgi:hypothetical protein